VAHKGCVVEALAQELRDLNADIFVNQETRLASELGTELRGAIERTPRHFEMTFGSLSGA